MIKLHLILDKNSILNNKKQVNKNRTAFNAE